MVAPNGGIHVGKAGLVPALLPIAVTAEEDTTGCPYRAGGRSRPMGRGAISSPHVRARRPDPEPARQAPALAAAGVPTYPHGFEWDLEPTDIKTKRGGHRRGAGGAGLRLRVPGRVRAIRQQGKIVFVDLHDGRAKLQLFIRKDQLPEEALLILDNLDLGDQLGASGQLIRTRAGELSLMVDGLTFLAKALRPMPEKWHGLADVEVRYRQRYLDLASNEESRMVFEIRAAIVRTSASSSTPAASWRSRRR